MIRTLWNFVWTVWTPLEHVICVHRQSIRVGMIMKLLQSEPAKTSVWTQCEHSVNTVYTRYTHRQPFHSCRNSEESGNICMHTVWTPYEHNMNTLWTQHEHHMNTLYTKTILPLRAFFCTHMNTLWTPYEHIVNTIWTRYTHRQSFPSGHSAAASAGLGFLTLFINRELMVCVCARAHVSVFVCVWAFVGNILSPAKIVQDSALTFFCKPWAHGVCVRARICVRVRLWETFLSMGNMCVCATFCQLTKCATFCQCVCVRHFVTFLSMGNMCVCARAFVGDILSHAHTHTPTHTQNFLWKGNMCQLSLFLSLVISHKRAVWEIFVCVCA